MSRRIATGWYPPSRLPLYAIPVSPSPPPPEGPGTGLMGSDLLSPPRTSLLSSGWMKIHGPVHLTACSVSLLLMSGSFTFFLSRCCYGLPLILAFTTSSFFLLEGPLETFGYFLFVGRLLRSPTLRTDPTPISTFRPCKVSSPLFRLRDSYSSHEGKRVPDPFRVSFFSPFLEMSLLLSPLRTSPPELSFPSPPSPLRPRD